MVYFSKLTVLIIDDEQMARDILQGMFEALGFREVVVRSDGFGAIEQLQTTKFDLVVLDVRLGTEDGLEVARALRGLDEFGSTRVLVVTASRDHETIIAAKRAGADDILLKPFVLTALQKRLEKLFAGQR